MSPEPAGDTFRGFPLSLVNSSASYSRPLAFDDGGVRIFSPEKTRWSFVLDFDKVCFTVCCHAVVTCDDGAGGGLL